MQFGFNLLMRHVIALLIVASILGMLIGHTGNMPWLLYGSAATLMGASVADCVLDYRN